MNTLAGKSALITGSSHGIGAEIARLFAQEGASVAVHGRDEGAVNSLVQQLRGAGSQAIGVVGDLSEPGIAERVVRESRDALGSMDVVVANAGGNRVPPGPIESIGADAWQGVIDDNLTVTYLTIAAALPLMKAQRRGSIVTVSSAASRRPTAQSPAAYAAAKAGIEVLTRMVALQAGPDGVRANCIAPETILTERNAGQIPAAIQEQLALAHPLRRLGTETDVAHAALYLASDDASWITGVVLDVAGGSVLA